MIVLFVDDCNGNESKNPLVSLVNVKTELPTNFIEHSFNVAELNQIGVGRMGGSWKKILQDLELEYEIISQGKLLDHKSCKRDITYKVISGNY